MERAALAGLLGDFAHVWTAFSVHILIQDAIF